MLSSAGRLADQSPAFMVRQPPAWVASYIGIPFKAKGRDRDGADCWGLFRLLYLEQYGIELPLYLEGYEGTDRADRKDVARLIASRPPEWRPVAAGDERLGDGIVLRMDGEEMHVGLVVARATMLHILEGINSTAERYDGPIWRQRVVGFHRWEGAGG